MKASPPCKRIFGGVFVEGTLLGVGFKGNQEETGGYPNSDTFSGTDISANFEARNLHGSGSSLRGHNLPKQDVVRMPPPFPPIWDAKLTQGGRLDPNKRLSQSTGQIEDLAPLLLGMLCFSSASVLGSEAH